MKENLVEFIFKARYCTLGDFSSSTKQIWFVLHGYGQLARFFIRKFETLTSRSIGLVAPEGLSRFYLEEMSKRSATGNNRVGATWMTAENRLMDIENYLHYLSAVHSQVMKNHPEIPVTILGFSQGSATASRWVIQHPDCCSRLILWAGIFPPDMEFDKAGQILTSKKLLMVYGRNDPYVTDQRLEEMTSINRRLRVSPEVLAFEGGHEIDDQTLQRLV